MRAKQTTNNNRFKLITYNLRFHTAYGDVKDMERSYQPDIICLQECLADELDDTIGDMVLAGKTAVGEQGLGVYCHNKRFSVIDSKSYALPKSIWELLVREVRHRLLVVRLRDKLTGCEVVVGCFHATHLVAVNMHRRRQIRRAMRILEADAEYPAILVGDYNYPFFHGTLKRFIKKAGYDMVAGAAATYRAAGYKGIFDFAALFRLSVARTEVLPQESSDHLPVMFHLDLPASE